MIRLISKTPNGKIFKCSECNAFHIEFKNLNFNFDRTQFRFFTESIQNINGEEWEVQNKDSNYTRKILIPTGQKGLNILFNSVELQELRNLLTGKVYIPQVVNKVINVDFSDISFHN